MTYKSNDYHASITLTPSYLHCKHLTDYRNRQKKKLSYIDKGVKKKGQEL
jgi:hypothetical protein